jgi:hypothetical protein
MKINQNLLSTFADEICDRVKKNNLSIMDSFHALYVQKIY